MSYWVDKGIPLWRNSIVVLSHTVNVESERWVELRSKLGDVPKAKTLSLMVMIKDLSEKCSSMPFLEESASMWHVSWNSPGAASPAPNTPHGQRPHAYPVLQKAVRSRLPPGPLRDINGM